MAESKPTISSSKHAGPVKSGGNRHTELIRQYTLLKRVSRWLLLAFMVFGILLTILSARRQRTPTPALQDGHLGASMAVSGKTIVVTAIRDNLQEILISADSGNTFVSTGERWPVVDSSLMLGISPDSTTIVAMDSKGLMRTMKKGDDHFVVRKLPILDKDTVKGFVFRYEGDRIFVFGSFPMQVHGLGDTVSVAYSILYNDSLRILSVASGPGGRLLAYVREQRTGRERLYFQTASDAFQPLGEDNTALPDTTKSIPQQHVNRRPVRSATDSVNDQKNQTGGYKK